jgi:DNA-binding NtrC family response regulator
MTRGRILIVDEDPAIRESVQKMLQLDGYEAQEAVSCRGAVQSFDAVAHFVQEAAAPVALVLENPVDDEKKHRQLNGLGQKLLRQRVAGANIPVLIRGETGASSRPGFTATGRAAKSAFWT